MPRAALGPHTVRRRFIARRDREARARLAAPKGAHPRRAAHRAAAGPSRRLPRYAPRPGALYVATLDLAGEDEAATDPIARLRNPARDYTACTIFEVLFPSDRCGAPSGCAAPGLPVYHAVDIFLDHGTRHFSADRCGAPSGCAAPDPSGHLPTASLVARLCAYLDHWQVAHLVADCTGVGQGVTSWLRAHLGDRRVTPYDFSCPRAKADLGSAFLSLIETNRFKYFQEDGCDAPPGCVAPEPTPEPQSSIVHRPSSMAEVPPTSSHQASAMSHLPLSDSWWFFQQAAACAYEIPPDGTLDANLRWGVPPSHRTETPAGPLPTHDDRLLSASLIANLDALLRASDLTLGIALSAVIPSRDPYGNPVY